MVRTWPTVKFSMVQSTVMPLNLAGICRRWREIVVNTPGLCRLYVVVYLDSNAWRKPAV
ncbi:hypothetical protein K503DRAFT_777258 [Rhizopogon vinicolor AM-OR11-026]|uniref:F-box domain-containing protein n=1 Tax=Rhizopogon vinicolor AM-OR11-026 TaxID=1314800 RepID=A0A1B7MGX2_9AGAM|nr:hypothetical protein K503DRAFT_777258 [Rhizopogon vinicolor AM-OR11-026]